MKTLFIFLSFVGTVYLTSCGNRSSHSREHVELQGPEYTAAYVCPMHCDGSGSEMEGTCPVCGMDYVKLEEHQADGHKHDGYGESRQ